MGDRGNIVVDGVWLYTHSQGSRIGMVLKDALSSEQGAARWTDGPYLTRIIICRMIDGANDFLGEYGFGISTRMCDNEHNILWVDTAKQEVREYKEVRAGIADTPLRSWSFEEFINHDYVESNDTD